MKIEFGFAQKDAYNFTLKTKTKEPVFANRELKAGAVKILIAENAPNVLKGIEYIEAPNPFGKYGFDEKFEAWGWTFSTVLLAFKHGYIDGWLMESGGLFQPKGSLSVQGIIVVDTDKRLEVRKYFEKEFKLFFENCKEEDFRYVILKDFFYEAYTGQRNSETLDDIVKRLKEKKGEDFFKTEREKSQVRKYGFDKVFDALANLLYYDTAMYNVWGQRLANPLMFDSVEAAEAFKKKYNTWEEIYRGKSNSYDIILVNDNFETWLKKGNDR